MDPPRDGAQALRPVIDGVHARHDGEQHLGGTDVAGGLFAPNVLLAGLQRQAVSGTPARIDGLADEAARHRPLVGIAGGEEGGMGAAEAERHAEALARADDDIGAELAWRGEQYEGERIARHHGESAGRVNRLDGGARVADRAGPRRILHEPAEHRPGAEIARRIANDHLDAKRARARPHHGDRLRQAIGGDEEGIALGPIHVAAHGHRLGRRRRLVQQRGIGDLHRRKVHHHGLEIEQRF